METTHTRSAAGSPPRLVSVERPAEPPSPGPVPGTGLGTSGAEAYRQAIQERLLPIWRDVLKAEQLRAEESLYDLGVDSLLMARILVRVEAAFAVALPRRSLYEAPSVAEFAALLANLLAGPEESRRPTRGASVRLDPVT